MKLFFLSPEHIQELEVKKADARKNINNMDALSMFVNQRKDAYVENSIGFIHIYGCLLNDTTPLDTMLGNTDYEDIIEETEELIASGAKSIVFLLDSPGGTVEGMLDTAEFIRDLSVPTVGFIKGQCCSAAMGLASAMTYLVSTKSSTVGNIGAIMAMVDTSGVYEKMGVKVVTFTNEGADLKNIGYEPSLTKKQTAFLQESINRTGEKFKSFVLDNRPEIDPLVFDARWVDGEEAVDLGLIDYVGNEVDAIGYAEILMNTFGTISDSVYESIQE